MTHFEMVVKDIFYLSNNRMVFSGHFKNLKKILLPINATIYVNGKAITNVNLVTLPFMSGPNVKKDIDCIEASEHIDLKFINWDRDSVVLKQSDHG